MHVKGQQTVEEVIETAMRGVKAGRRRIVSGFTNYLVSRIVTIVPNALITRALAGPMRVIPRGTAACLDPKFR